MQITYPLPYKVKTIVKTYWSDEEVEDDGAELERDEDVGHAHTDH